MAYCAKCYLCNNTLYLKGSWWGLLNLLSSRQLGMAGCLMRHQMLPPCCSFCAGICAPDTFPWWYCSVPGCPVLTAVSKCKTSVGSKCLWMCYYPPETLRRETVLIGGHLHDCARSSEAFWSQGIFINGDDMCTSPAHARTWTTRKLKHSRYPVPDIIN